MSKNRRIPKPKRPLEEDLNTLAFDDYLERLSKIALSIFEWENLPSSMDARMLELTLFQRGSAAIIKDIEKGVINTAASDNGNLNIYGLPTSIHCFAFNFSTDRGVYSGLVKDENEKVIDMSMSEGILVKNNFSRISTLSSLQLYASRLAEAERVIDVNLRAQKTPIVLLVDDNQRLTIENAYAQYDGNKPVIIADKSMKDTLESIKAIKTDAPYIVDKVMQYKNSIWNEALSFLGVDNLEQKKERMVVDEIGQNNEQVNLNLESFLIPRQEAAKQCNELFGTNISVRVRSDLANLIKLADAQERSGINIMESESNV